MGQSGLEADEVQSAQCFSTSTRGPNQTGMARLAFFKKSSTSQRATRRRRKSLAAMRRTPGRVALKAGWRARRPQHGNTQQRQLPLRRAASRAAGGPPLYHKRNISRNTWSQSVGKKALRMRLCECKHLLGNIEKGLSPPNQRLRTKAIHAPHNFSSKHLASKNASVVPRPEQTTAHQ